MWYVVIVDLTMLDPLVLGDWSFATYGVWQVGSERAVKCYHYEYYHHVESVAWISKSSGSMVCISPISAVVPSEAAGHSTKTNSKSVAKSWTQMACGIGSTQCP